MSDYVIRTNNQLRNTLTWFELTDKERGEFDYLSEDQQDCATFIRYKRWVYDLSDFTRIDGSYPEPMNNWHGYRADSFYSGVLIKLDRHHDAVICATYIA